MMKKLFQVFTSIALACMLVFTVNPALAASSSRGGFSGGGSYGSHSSIGGSYSGGSYSSSGSYRSGVRSPSSSVGQRPSTGGSGFGYTAPRSSWGSFFGGMAAGALAGSLFHHMFSPFSYGYGGFGLGHSLFGLIMDVLILYIGYRIIRRLFFR